MTIKKSEDQTPDVTTPAPDWPQAGFSGASGSEARPTDRISSHKCDALTHAGARCSRSASWRIPCQATYDARCTSYTADIYRAVHLCSAHAYREDRLRRKNERLPLHSGGFLGATNRHQYGSLVLAKPVIDWDSVTNDDFRVPDYWQQGMRRVRPQNTKPSNSGQESTK